MGAGNLLTASRRAWFAVAAGCLGSRPYWLWCPEPFRDCWYNVSPVTLFAKRGRRAGRFALMRARFLRGKTRSPPRPPDHHARRAGTGLRAGRTLNPGAPGLCLGVFAAWRPTRIACRGVVNATELVNATGSGVFFEKKPAPRGPTIESKKTPDPRPLHAGLAAHDPIPAGDKSPFSWRSARNRPGRSLRRGR